MTAQTAVWAGSIGFLFSNSIGAGEPAYYVYVATGIALYMTFTIFFSDGVSAFLRESSLILNVPNPYLIYVGKLSVKALLQVVMSLPVLAAALYLSHTPLKPVALLALPGLALALVFGSGLSMFLASIAVRMRDLVFAVQAAMRLLLFITPVFWLVETRGGTRGMLAHVNPLYHHLQMVRAPLMGSAPEPINVVFAIGSAVIALAIGFMTFALMRKRIAIWL
jgi:ABC-type polysaccharide/polyol phosphate export permease